MKFRNGCFVMADCCSFCDVYMIDIDDERMELNDYNGFVIGTIGYEDIQDSVELIEYNADGHMGDDIITLCEKGKLCHEVCPK